MNDAAMDKEPKMTIKALKIASLFLAVLLLFSGPAFSQAGRGTGRVRGVVLDLEGKPIAGASVTLTFSESASLKLETKTDRKGEWAFLGLGSGSWKLDVSVPGFLSESSSLNIVQLSLNPKITVNLKRVQKTTSAYIQDESTLKLLDEGNQFFKEEKYETALAIYQEFLQKNPAAYQILISIGDCYREKGEFDKAAENYNKAVEEAKKDPAIGKEVAAKGLAGIGNCFLKQGKIPEAQDFFKKSIENAPNDEILAYNVGEIYFSNQNPDEALKYFGLASQIKAEWPDPYFRMGYVYLNKGDNANAITKFEKFLSLEPDTERSAQAKNILSLIKK
jgi:tetratricopeptide (TPR) repeat protein